MPDIFYFAVFTAKLYLLLIWEFVILEQVVQIYKLNFICLKQSGKSTGKCDDWGKNQMVSLALYLKCML